MILHLPLRELLRRGRVDDTVDAGDVIGRETALLGMFATRRLVGGVLFCCDAGEEGLEGGALGMWRETDPDDRSRICANPELGRSYPAKHNTGVLFLNSPDGYHGPTPIRHLTGQRRWIYYSISSRHPVWPS